MASDVTIPRSLVSRWTTALALRSDRVSIWSAEGTHTSAEPAPTAAEPSQTPNTLRVRMTGTPTGSDAISVETVRGGHVDDGAAYLWRPDTFPVSSYRRRQQVPRIGDATTIYTSPATQITIDAVAAGETPLGRPIVAMSGIRVSTGERVLTVLSTNALGNWTETTLTDGDMVEASAKSGGIAVIGRPDGVDVYACIDTGRIRRWTSSTGSGGWSEVPIRIDSVIGEEQATWSIPGAYAQGFGPTWKRLAVARGGGRMLMVGYEQDEERRHHWASDDDGHTWTRVTGGGPIGSTGVDGVPPDLAVTYTAEAGFVVAIPAHLIGGVTPVVDQVEVYADPFQPSNVTQGLATTIGAARVSLFQADGSTWLLEAHAGTPGDDRGLVRFRESTDGGRTFPDLVDTSMLATSGLPVETPSAVVGFSAGGASYLLEASNDSTGSDRPTLMLYTLGGASTEKAFEEADTPVGWDYIYAAHFGYTPTETADARNGADALLGQVSTNGGNTAKTWPSPGGMQVVTTASQGWTYDPAEPGGDVTAWLVEVDVEMANGELRIRGDLEKAKALVVIDADADTLGLYAGNNMVGLDAEVLLGSTTTVPAGRFVVRLVVSGLAASAWYRTDGTTWVPIAEGQALTEAVAPVSFGREVDLTGDDDADYTLHGWRIADVSRAVDTEAQPTALGLWPWTSSARLLADGIEVSAAGYTTPGQSWTLRPGAEHTSEHLLVEHATPRRGWLADGNGAQTIAFELETEEYASAHALLLEGVRADSVQVEVRIDGSWGTYGTIDLTRTASEFDRLGSRLLRYGRKLAGVGTDPYEYVAAGELVGATVRIDGQVFRVVTSSGGVLADSAPHPVRPVLELDGTVPAVASIDLLLPRAVAILHHEPDDIVEGFRLTFAAPDFPAECANAIFAPVTWLPEGPDQTRTLVQELREIAEEHPDGTTTTTRNRPDRRRADLNFARLFPMYAQSAGDFNWFKMGDDVGPAGVTWTTPQELMALLRQAGRQPMLYLPAVPIDTTQGGYSLQVLDYPAALQAMQVRVATDAFRHEGVLGQAATADQLVRMSTVPLVEEV
jgi:hypothetical protein